MNGINFVRVFGISSFCLLVAGKAFAGYPMTLKCSTPSNSPKKYELTVGVNSEKIGGYRLVVTTHSEASASYTEIGYTVVTRDALQERTVELTSMATIPNSNTGIPVFLPEADQKKYYLNINANTSDIFAYFSSFNIPSVELACKKISP